MGGLQRARSVCVSLISFFTVVVAAVFAVVVVVHSCSVRTIRTLRLGEKFRNFTELYSGHGTLQILLTRSDTLGVTVL